MDFDLGFVDVSVNLHIKHRKNGRFFAARHPTCKCFWWGLKVLVTVRPFGGCADVKRPVCKHGQCSKQHPTSGDCFQRIETMGRGGNTSRLHRRAPQREDGLTKARITSGRTHSPLDH